MRAISYNPTIAKQRNKPMKSNAGRIAALTVAISCLCQTPLGAVERERGKVGQGGSPLLVDPDILNPEKTVCSLPQGTSVELLLEKPMLGPDGKVAFPGFYKQVRVLDGSCAGRTGWLTHEKYSR